MRKWIITGGIGTGKSSFCQVLKRLMPEAVLFSSDESVHRAYEVPEVREELASSLGLATTEGSAEDFRAEVRKVVVAQPESRKKLEAVLHPYVWAELEILEAEAVKAGVNVLVAEVPLYYETARAVVADKIVVLAASQAVQLSRVQARRGVDEATALAMLKMQLPLADKIALADMVVWNDGSASALEQAAITLLRQI